MKLLILWERVRDSLWFLPTVMTLVASILAIVMVRVDTHVLTYEMAREHWWLFGGSAEGARGLLTAIAGSVMTVTGVVFSITIVALQLASSQFSPRVLQNFMKDRANQTVLGVFVGTFTYTLLVLRSVRSPIEDADRFVPGIAISGALTLAIVSIAFLIYYLDHVASWIEASSIINRVTKDTMHEVRAQHPTNAAVQGERAPIAEAQDLQDGEVVPSPDGGSRPGSEVWMNGHDWGYLLARRSGYVRMTSVESLLKHAIEHHVVLRIDHAVGDFVLEATPIVGVSPREALTEKLEEQLRESFALGTRRTISQDPMLGIIQLSDIAVKAMSPSINDPTTAMLAIDRLAQVLAEIGSRAPREHVCFDELGGVRLVMPVFGFDAAVRLGFDPIRRYAAGDPAVLSHLAGSAAAIGTRIGPDDRDVLRRLLDDLETSARGGIEHETDLARVARAVAEARRLLGLPDARD